MNRPVSRVIDDSVRLRLYPEDGCARLIYYFGEHSPGLAAFLDDNLKSGMTVVDVGANIGAFSLMAARRVGTGGRVLAVEPDPKTLANLVENVAVNGFVQVRAINCALGDSEGTTVLSATEESSRNFLLPASLDSAVGSSVTVRTLDDVILEAGVDSVDYLKIDVEGYEMHVLRGAGQVIRGLRPRVIQLECIPRLLARYGSGPVAVGALLEEFGYRVSCLACGGEQDLSLRLAIEAELIFGPALSS